MKYKIREKKIMGLGSGLTLHTTIPPLNIIAETWGKSSFRTQFPT